jgi:hypothetical protein
VLVGETRQRLLQIGPRRQAEGVRAHGPDL